MWQDTQIHKVIGDSQINIGCHFDTHNSYWQVYQQLVLTPSKTGLDGGARIMNKAKLILLQLPRLLLCSY